MDKHQNFDEEEAFDHDGFDHYVDNICEKTGQKDDNFSKTDQIIIEEEKEKEKEDQILDVIKKSQTQKKEDKLFFKQTLDKKSITFGSTFSALRIKEKPKPKFKKSGSTKHVDIFYYF